MLPTHTKPSPFLPPLPCLALKSLDPYLSSLFPQLSRPQRHSRAKIQQLLLMLLMLLMLLLQGGSSIIIPNTHSARR